MNDYNMMNNIMSNFFNPEDLYPQAQMHEMKNEMPMKKDEIGTPKEGYTLGNLFVNTYIPYKNYIPQKLVAHNEQEALFLQMSEVAFAAHELNLYLDLHPTDQAKLKMFNQFRKKANELRTQYENQYGPISINANVLDNSPFLWEELPFPWKGGIQ